MDKELGTYISAQKERLIEDLGRLVAIRSVRGEASEGKPFGSGPAEALAEAEKIAAEHGFDLRNFENYAGEISFGKDPVLMLLAHLDVVNEGDNWTKEPYRLTREGDRLYGRGTTDDKGAALACLYAAEAVRECFGEPDRGLRIVLGCGEETGSEDMAYYFSKRDKLPYTLSPDAEYPLINIEKGRFAPVFTREIADGGCIREIRGGDTANIVPAKARALLACEKEAVERLFPEAEEATGTHYTAETKNGLTEVTCTGISAHGSLPEKGNNANSGLIELLCRLPEDTPLMKGLVSLKKLFPHGDTAGETIGVSMEDEETGKLSFNFGVLSYDGKTLTGGLDLRCPLCADEHNVKDVIGAALEKEGFRFVGDPPMRKVHYVPADAPIVREALKVYREYTGKEGRCLAIGGGTYVHDIEGGVAFGIEWEGTDYRIHGADEFAEADELLLTSAMYAQIIKDLCYGGDKA